MTNLQLLQDAFWSTRLEAKAAYRKWQNCPNSGSAHKEGLYHHLYLQAWQSHNDASMKLFLIECEE